MTLSNDKVSAADKHWCVWTALLALSLSEDDKSLQPLLNTQLWCKNDNAPTEVGYAKTEDLWYWMVGRPSGLSPAEETEWQIESTGLCIYLFYLPLMICTANRVKWFCAHTACDHAREEVEILEEEFRHAHRSFEWMAEVWTELAGYTKDNKGKAAYGHKQSAMYRQLALDCNEAFQKVHPTVERSTMGE